MTRSCCKETKESFYRKFPKFLDSHLPAVFFFRFFFSFFSFFFLSFFFFFYFFLSFFFFFLISSDLWSLLYVDANVRFQTV